MGACRIKIAREEPVSPTTVNKVDCVFFILYSVNKRRTILN